MGEQQVRCYELKLAGWTLEAIAAEMHLSIGTVHNRIQARLDARVQPLADQLRTMEVDRLDRYLAKLDDLIQQGKAVARNTEVAVKVSERRSKIMGIDAAEKIEAVITEVTQEDIALGELVREAQAAAAVSEQRLREATS